jgi:hypothetical protein
MQRVAISWRIISRIFGITMTSIKLYYLCLLNSIAEPDWATIHGYFVANMRPRTVVSTRTAVPGAMITTADAHTLTDGPTIWRRTLRR